MSLEEALHEEQYLRRAAMACPWNAGTLQPGVQSAEPKTMKVQRSNQKETVGIVRADVRP